MKSKWAPLWPGLLLLFIGVSCQTDIRVDVDVEDGGSGSVVAVAILDKEAADGLLDLSLDSAGIPLSDLAQAGWVVDRQRQTADGGVEIRASKQFGTPAQFSEVMAELSGPAGPFTGFTLERRQSFGRLDYVVEGTLDTSEGFAMFSDDELDGALPRSVQSIAEQYGANEQDVAIELNVTLPGEIQEDGTNGRVDGTPTEVDATYGWSATVASRERSPITMATTQLAIMAQVLRGLAALAAVVAGVLLLSGLLRWLGGRNSGPSGPSKPRPADAKGRSPQEVEAAREELRGDPEPEPGQFSVVALDGMGVLYKEAEDVTKLLIPFARERGSMATDEEIIARAYTVSLGRMTSFAFWLSIGVAGDPNELDAAYLATHQLSPGVVKYLRRLRSHGVRSACITNDGAEWAMKLRGNHSLEGLIDPWVVSGSVGVRKPDRPVFEVLRRLTGEPPQSILVIDDDLDILDAARSYGFGTAWFSAEGERAHARGHEILRNFDVDMDSMDIEGVDAEIVDPESSAIASADLDGSTSLGVAGSPRGTAAAPSLDRPNMTGPAAASVTGELPAS